MITINDGIQSIFDWLVAQFIRYDFSIMYYFLHAHNTLELTERPTCFELFMLFTERKKNEYIVCGVGGYREY